MEKKRVSTIKELISECKNRKITSMELVLSCKVSIINKRVATFTWLLNKYIGESVIEYYDKESECWFDDGYPYPSEHLNNASDFTYINSRKGSQFEPVIALMKSLYELEKNSIGIERIIGHEIQPILDWFNLVSECVKDDKKRRMYDSMFSGIPRTQEIK